jgi:hypothetical protein
MSCGNQIIIFWLSELFTVGGGGVTNYIPGSYLNYLQLCLIHFFMFMLAACPKRAAEGQLIQSTKRQACVYPQLLQSHK